MRRAKLLTTPSISPTAPSFRPPSPFLPWRLSLRQTLSLSFFPLPFLRTVVTAKSYARNALYMTTHRAFARPLAVLLSMYLITRPSNARHAVYAPLNRLRYKQVLISYARTPPTTIWAWLKKAKRPRLFQKGPFRTPLWTTYL